MPLACLGFACSNLAIKNKRLLAVYGALVFISFVILDSFQSRELFSNREDSYFIHVVREWTSGARIKHFRPSNKFDRPRQLSLSLLKVLLLYLIISKALTIWVNLAFFFCHFSSSAAKIFPEFAKVCLLAG